MNVQAWERAGEAVESAMRAIRDTEALNLVALDEAQQYQHYTQKAIALGLVAVAEALRANAE